MGFPELTIPSALFPRGEAHLFRDTLSELAFGVVSGLDPPASPEGREQETAFPPWGLGRGSGLGTAPGGPARGIRASEWHKERALDWHPIGHCARVTDTRCPSASAFPVGTTLRSLPTRVPRATTSSVAL